MIDVLVCDIANDIVPAAVHCTDDGVIYDLPKSMTAEKKAELRQSIADALNAGAVDVPIAVDDTHAYLLFCCCKIDEVYPWQYEEDRRLYEGDRPAEEPSSATAPVSEQPAKKPADATSQYSNQPSSSTLDRRPTPYLRAVWAVWHEYYRDNSARATQLQINDIPIERWKQEYNKRHIRQQGKPVRSTVDRAIELHRLHPEFFRDD